MALQVEPIRVALEGPDEHCLACAAWLDPRRFRTTYWIRNTETTDIVGGPYCSHICGSLELIMGPRPAVLVS